jgi:hypothetical protein
MIFGPKKQNIPHTIKIKVENQIIDTVTQTKFLGVIIDSGLTWKPHILQVSQKIAKTIGILSLARKYFNQPTLLQLYHSFIFPYLSYCNLAWGNAADSTLWPLYKKQKLAIRLIANIPRGSSSLPFCKKNAILRLPEIYKQSMGIFMYKFNHNQLPDIFASFFHKNTAFHTYQTRNANKLRVPLLKTAVASKFIKKTGVGFWNELEDTITGSLKIGAFKSHLKKYLLSPY